MCCAKATCFCSCLTLDWLQHRSRDHQHPVIEIRQDGIISHKFLSVADMLRGHSDVQVRDLISLGIDSLSRASSHHAASSGSPILFARGDTLLCGIGWLKTLIYSDRMIIFTDNGLHSEAFAEQLSALLEERNAFMLAKSRSAQPGQGGSGAAEDAVGGEDAVSLSLASDFEMIVLEKMLEV